MTGNVKSTEPPDAAPSSNDEETMVEMAAVLEQVFEGSGFVLLVCPLGEDPTDTKIVSNLTTSGVRPVLSRLLARLENL